MVYKVGMKFYRHSYSRGKKATGHASTLKHTIIEVSPTRVRLDSTGWWTKEYMDTCFTCVNKTHVGGE